MEIKQAIEILHPDTTLSTLAEIEYYAGFNGHEAKIKACDEACEIVCNEIKRLQKENAELKAIARILELADSPSMKHICEISQKIEQERDALKSQLSKAVELLELAQPDIYRQCSNCAHWAPDPELPAKCKVGGCRNLYKPDRWQWQHAAAMRELIGGNGNDKI